MIAEKVLLWTAGQQLSGTPVKWNGGISAFVATSTAWGGGTVTLNLIASDGTTPVPVGTSTTGVTANSLITPLYLPAGLYSAVVTGTPAALFVSLEQAG